MKSVKNEFTGNISSDCQQQSVPTELITLVNMLLEGSNVTHFYKPKCVNLCTAFLI